MEFRDLKKQYILHKNEIDTAINTVLQDTNFIMGAPVKKLEETLAEYVGVKHCISCANGTDALQLALMTWGIGPSDAVFVPDFTFFSSGEVVSALGATPIFVDIDEDTYNVSPECLEKAIQTVIAEGKVIPKAIVAVDLFGQPADFNAIREIAEKYHLYLLEDGAQGFGGSIDGKKACSFGDISTTSFFPAKPLGCYGDGGAIFTDNDEYAERLRSLRVHGKGTDKYDNVRIGMNSRLDTIQAAVLLEKIKFFAEELVSCNRCAEEYTKQLKGIVKTPAVLPTMVSCWAQYTICFSDQEQRDLVMTELKNREIPSAVYYKKPMHMQEAFSHIYHGKYMNEVTTEVCQRCLSLPMHAYLEQDEIEKICNAIKEIVTKG